MVACMLFPNFSFGQHNEHEQKTDEHENHVNEHQSHKNHIAMFIGATTIVDHHLTLFSVGVDYEYKLEYFHEKLGIGLGGEFLTGETTALIASIPIFYHPVSNLTLLAAPLIVYEKEHNEHSDAETEEAMKAFFAYRLGVNYSFHINNISISPGINFDFGDTMAIEYGLGIGFGF